MVCRHGPAGVFQSVDRGHRRRSRSVQYGLAVRYVLRSGGFGLFAGQTAGAVVLKTGIHFALAAQGFPMQVVALYAADDLNVMD